MNIKRFLIGILAAAAVITGCEPKEIDYGVARIEVSTSTLSFEASSSSQTLQLTATRDWTVAGLPDWIAVDPASGGPSLDPQSVTVTVISNDSFDREADITFTIGLMKEYVKVSQKGQKGQIDYGKGTLEHPFSVDGVIAYINSLDNPSADSPEKVYVKGKISAVGEEYTTQYGNGTFDISDDGTTSGTQFKVYRALYLGNRKFGSKDTQVKVGDDVIVYGNVVLYGSGSPVYETSQGNAYLYSLNGVTGGGSAPAGDPKGTGTKDDPFNVAAALKAVSGLSWTSNDNYEKLGPFYIKGKVSSISEAYGTQYGNGTFYISDDGSSDNEFYVFRALYLGNEKFKNGDTQIKVGDDVVIYGEIMNYRGNTPETVQNSAYLYSLNGETGGGGDDPEPGDPKGTGTLNDPYNPAGAANAVKDLTWTANDNYETTGEVYVKGKISRIADNGTFTEGGNYGNASFYISEDGTSAGEFYCYRVLYLGNKKFESGQTDIKVGDDVVIYGQLMNYRGNTPETVSGKAYLYSLNGKTEGGDEPDEPSEPGTPAGSGTQADPYNVAAALDAVKDLTWTSNDVYDKVGPFYVKGIVSSVKEAYGTQYGNGTFYISDDGKTGNEFYVYRALYLGNEKYAAGNTQIKVGDEVVIYGELMNYRGDTPETVANGAYLYSLNGKTEAESSGDDPSGGEDTGDYASNVTWALDSSAYDQDATVNGTTGVKVLKLGTSSKYGKATLTLPEGSTKLKFYALSWNNAAAAKLVFKVGDKEVATVSPTPNSGLAGNPTYTLTVTSSDYYTVDLGSAATTVTVETTEGYRAALFAVKAE